MPRWHVIILHLPRFAAHVLRLTEQPRPTDEHDRETIADRLVPVSLELVFGAFPFGRGYRETSADHDRPPSHCVVAPHLDSIIQIFTCSGTSTCSETRAFGL